MWFEPHHTIQFWGITIQVWGLMLAIGTILAWYLFDYNLIWRKIKLDSSVLILGFVLFALVGARFFQVILFWDYYRDNLWEIPKIWEGGLASYGAYFFGIGWLIYYVRRQAQRNDILDAATVSALLGLALARFGCFLIDDHLGKPTNLPWAIWSNDELRHPISLYYFGSNMVLFAVSAWLFYQNKLRGQLLWWALICYGIIRVVIDILFKDFEGRSINMWGTYGASAIFVIIGIMVLSKLRKDF